MGEKLSVVVCVRNEEKRIRDCLVGVYANNPDEVILVDGNSSDKTVAIAREFPGIHTIVSKNSNLTRDRQIGIDAARNELVAMIDGDHRLKKEDLEALYKDMVEYDLDIVQAGLVSSSDTGYWHRAEGALWELTQNAPGPRTMISTAPSIYKKSVFKKVRFNDSLTSTVDDTDFMYRLSKFPELRVGVGKTKVVQHHFADLGIYLKKFQMYGKGDGEFCRKHPNRAPSMLFHLLIRYPFLYSWRAIRAGKAYAAPFFMLHGTMRFVGLARYFLRAI
ncbi:glycosyltransferase family 2 protein [Candidatus Kaiserbacteria bacterium]|nr:glycosyltransferase family 2 protein [Candidatus Kaiserbacteria bacterium]